MLNNFHSTLRGKKHHLRLLYYYDWMNYIFILIHSYMKEGMRTSVEAILLVSMSSIFTYSPLCMYTYTLYIHICVTSTTDHLPQ